MRARRLEAHGFGRLSGRAFAFGDRLTIVHGANEAGKSTLHAAMVASLFGLAGGGRKTKDVTTRIERHRPWVGDRYAATIEVGDTDRSLRVEWDFDRGRHVVRDALTGADLTAAHGGGTNADELVRTLYGVDRATYLRIGCVRQAELAAVEEPADVRHAIELALTSAAADASAEAAADALRAERARTVGLVNAAAKPLPMARAEAKAAEEAVRAAEADRAAADRLAAERDEARSQAGVLEGRVHELQGILGHLRAAELRRKVAEAERLAEAEAAAGRAVAATSGRATFEPEPALPAWRDRRAELRSVRRPADAEADIAAMAELDAREQAVAARIAELEPARGAAAREAQVERALAGAGGRGRGMGVATLVAGLAIIAGGAAGVRALMIAGLVVAVAGLVLLARAGRARAAVAAVLPGDGPAGDRLAEFRRAVAADRELAAAERELAAIRLQASGLRERLAGDRRVAQELAGVEDRLRAALHARGFDDADLAAALVRYDQAVEERRAHDRGAADRARAEAELRRLLDGASLAELRGRLQRLEAGLNGHGPAAEGRDADEVAAALAAATAQRDAAVARSERADGQAAARLDVAADVAAARERLAAAVEEVERLEEVDAVLRLAESELRAAAVETYRDVAPRLNDALGAGIDRLTGGRYTRAMVGEDLAVHLEAPETGRTVALDVLSVGTAKQVFLVERLELVRMLCPDASVPVILDDPFAHFDADRIERTLAYLAELAAERQIVVFTTQDEVVARAPAGATVIELEAPG